ISQSVMANCCISKRYIPMLFWRVFVSLGVEHLQSIDQLLAGFAGADHSIDVSTFGGYVGISKAFAEFFDLFAALAFKNSCAFSFCLPHLGGTFELTLVYDIYRSFRPHYCYLGGGPGVFHIGADVL